MSINGMNKLMRLKARKQAAKAAAQQAWKRLVAAQREYERLDSARIRAAIEYRDYAERQV